ncbi:hypothetical protein ACFFWC_28250 [Plantactinospora siamensis]|uniref:Immunity protein 35 domain-containing protein n=1 Tax=Plantactinospora siamensis TaxID=555372 RepID=A0ABV6NQ19_9ACTN
MTEDEARALILRLLGTPNPVDLYPFEFGWAAQEILSPTERAQGINVGQGTFVIDQTGVVTVHSSLPVPLIIDDYTEARREGRITGRQVWPTDESTGQPTA